MSFSKIVPATINLLLSFGDIYDLIAPTVKKKFTVKIGQSSLLLGALQFNDTAALVGSQTGTTLIENNKLVVTFVNDNVQTGLFISSNDLPTGFVPVNNVGTWADTEDTYKVPKDFAFARTVIPVPNRNRPLQKDKLGFEYAEHCFIGDAITLTLPTGQKVAAGDYPFKLMNGLNLTYGQINGLGGSFYGTSNPISDGGDGGDCIVRFLSAFGTLANPSERQPKEATEILAVLQAEVNAINDALKNHQDPSVAYSKLPDVTSRLDDITFGRPGGQPGYTGLAKINWDSFGLDARQAYDAGHAAALGRAIQGDLSAAYALNAFADHFLVDTFSAGHLRVPRRMLHDGTEEMDYCAKLMQEEDSAIGLSVRNPAGLAWMAYGDKRALDSVNQINKGYCVDAVQASADEIYRAFVSRSAPKSYNAWTYAPTVTSACAPTQVLAPLFTVDGSRRKDLSQRKLWNFTEDWFSSTTVSDCLKSGDWNYPININGQALVLLRTSIALTSSKTHTCMFHQTPSGDIVQTVKFRDRSRPVTTKLIVKAVLFTPLAALNWNDGKEIRIYYLDRGFLLQEYCYSADRNQWYLGTLGRAKIHAASNTSIAAIHHTNGREIPFIRVFCQEISSLVIAEFYKPRDSIGGGWATPRNPVLPAALSGTSITAVTFYDDRQVRLYYQADDLSIREHSFIHSWYPGTFSVQGVPGCVPIRAVCLNDTNLELRIYWQDLDQGLTVVQTSETGSWGSARRVFGRTSGNQYTTCYLMDERRHMLYYQRPDASIFEIGSYGTNWTGETLLATGQLQPEDSKTK